MSVIRHKQTQFLPLPKEQAWDFFSSPLNLRLITPSYMNFVMESSFAKETKIYPGMIIVYTVSPVMNIPLTWVTEITHVKEGSYFIDEQRIGPYELWHHEHFIYEKDHGVEIVDVIHYKLKMVFGGSLLNGVVKKKVESIFMFREKKLKELFPEN